ncbi:synaptic vesicle glycoprotein 2C [Clupea harengus]|uniref:Synaptic vesicle glycoprotein 2C n=1 Tax=Clupea harengus TaxID=7950 RepID=A0A8M1KNM7_CLUHA|nr:synaptic vesicle glycoprotein 2C [Clupea harengus]
MGDAHADIVWQPLLTRNNDASKLDSDEEDVVFERRESDTTHSNTSVKLSYAEAIEEAGFGLFHGLLLVICGWANASDAVEILCVSFLLPTARCDLQLNSSDMGILMASLFLGMMIGGYTWGYLADRRGRQKVLVTSLTVNGIFGALASLATRFWLFLLLRFISGFGVGGSIPVIFSYFSEFQPRYRRGAMISALATFWMAGNILAAGLAWLVIPSTSLRFQLGSLDFQSWRLFMVLCAIPSLSSALVFKLAMPESPKFLIETGQHIEALRVFRKMFVLNHRGSMKPFPMAGLLHSLEDKKETASPVSREVKSPRLAGFFRRVTDPIRQIFNGTLASRSTALTIIFYCISFGYYGLWMWFPELFKRTEDGGSPCANVSRSRSDSNEDCYPVKTAVYMEGFLTALASLPGNIFTILMMDRIGGKVLLSISLLVSSLSVFFIWEVTTKTQSLIMCCVFSGVSVIAWNALDVIGTELYPTQLRSSALGFFTGVGRVGAIMGNVVFGQLVDTNCAVPILCVSLLLLTSGLVALRLPKTKQAELT